ncbi:MAG: HAMP domain-containing protein [Chloroflexi bacterium]|nr:HAMP domain-containing protein [Chloroflexota bacterium]
MKALFRWSSLSFQLVGVMLLLTLGLGLIRTYLNRAEVAAFAREQFEQRSAATASAFAAYATDAVLTNDLFYLNELIGDTLLNNPDVRYILVLDTERRVLAQSFGRGVPRGLIAANRAEANERYRAQRISTEEGLVLDVAVPLFDGKIGMVRVGMSERAMNADIDRHTFNLLLVTALSLVPVFIAAYLLARVLARPLEKLVQVTGAVARGDFTRAAPIAGQDEIAQLGAAFNAMTRALARSQGELRASNEQLRQRNEELAALHAIAQERQREVFRRQLLERVIDAQEEERKHVARELHDEFAQSLTALIVGLQTHEQQLASEDATRGRLAETRTLAAQILDQTRRLIFDLRPTILDDAGLAPALRSFAERACERAHLALDLQVQGPRRRLAPHIETTLFRIVQEAVNNIVQHAGAQRIAICLQFDATVVSICVSDDGRGFVVEEALGAGAIGLLGMRERAELLGGHLEIASELGKGTWVRVEIPIT